VQLILTQIENKGAAYEIVDEFEREILRDYNVKCLYLQNKYIYKFLYSIYRFRKKFGISFYLHKRPKTPLSDKKHRFVVMMAWEPYKCLPFFVLSSHYKSIYLFDAWQHDHEDIKSSAVFYKIDYIFTSSSQAASLLRETVKDIRIKWIPEGITPNEYKFLPYDKKNIDVLSVGRKYNQHHEKIVKELEQLGLTYIYEKNKGQLIFPDRKDFINGLARSKISICVPSSVTHPERAGNIETMTIRYLQSMVSKCLVLGHAPQEMIDVFGYKPVIELDMKNPVSQISYLLDNFNSYVPLIEKNYKEVLNNHTWENRWNTIKSIYTQQEQKK